MSKTIRELITRYVPLKQEIFKLEDEIYQIPCMYRKFVDPVAYDHNGFHICVNQDHTYRNSLVALCSLKYCPLKVLKKSKGEE